MEQYIHKTENLTGWIKGQKRNIEEQDQEQQQPYNELSDKLCRYGQCDMYNYLEKLELNSLSKSIVLLSSNHYFFKKEELRGIEMLVDIQNLSTRKTIEPYLNSIHSNIPDGCYFTGCFKAPTSKFSGKPDYHQYLFEFKQDLEEMGKGSDNLLGMIDKMINRLTISLSQNLTRADVEELFMKTGFNVMDMTEINGRIYFSAIKKPRLNNHYSLS